MRKEKLIGNKFDSLLKVIQVQRNHTIGINEEFLQDDKLLVFIKSYCLEGVSSLLKRV